MAAQSSIGSIGPFQAGTEDCLSYTERLELFFIANGIEDAEKRRATLLTVCGPSTYQLIQDLLAPDKPTARAAEDYVVWGGTGWRERSAREFLNHYYS